MAWEGQCKSAFIVACEAKYNKQKIKNIRAALRELAKESGIPYNTLKRWFYEKEEEKKGIKNDTPQEYTENTENNGAKNESRSETVPQSIKKCRLCGSSNIYLHTITRKPYSRKSAAYMLCGNCRNMVYDLIAIDREATKDNGIMVVCKACNEIQYINKERIK